MSNQARGEWTSASNAQADRLCQGRHQAQRGLPELPPSDESQEGRVIHALWTGTKPERPPTLEERDKAQAFRQQETTIALQFFPSTKGLIRLVERRLWHELPATQAESQGNILKTSGQFDIALVHPKTRRALICDGKSGWRAVSANPTNLQLRRLAALLWLELDCQEVGVCILKPFGKTEPPCVYRVSDLQRSVKEMEEDVRQSHAPDALRTAGEEQCRYCRAREICPTRLTWLSRALPASFPSLPMVSARSWSPEQRALFLEREQQARDWLQARKEEIKALLLEDPTAVPGYDLKPGRTIETINDPQTVWERFSRDLGGSLSSFAKCLKVGKTRLQEEVRALKRHGGKALEADMESLLAGCVEVTRAAPSIERTNGKTRVRVHP